VDDAAANPVSSGPISSWPIRAKIPFAIGSTSLIEALSLQQDALFALSKD